MLKEQLQKQIEQEAQQYFEAMPDILPYIAWRSGATQYAALWQAAEEKAAKYEKAAATLVELSDKYAIALMKIGSGCEAPQQVANAALTPKTSEDEKG